jgi:membrane-bound lytic murein transglycosylase B
VANYFKVHGWQPGAQVVVSARVNTHMKDDIEETRNKLKPHTLISEMTNNGIYPQSEVDNTLKATLVTLEGNDGKEYWLGLDNFYVITRYNHSALYAMAVYQLSREFDTQK